MTRERSSEDVTPAKCRRGENIVAAMERRIRELKAAGWTITSVKHLDDQHGVRISYERMAKP